MLCARGLPLPALPPAPRRSFPHSRPACLPAPPAPPQVHLRRMVGGPAVVGDGGEEVQDERIFKALRSAPVHSRVVVVGKSPMPKLDAVERSGSAHSIKLGSSPAAFCLLQVDYPERHGQLLRLLSPLSPRWDITLLHFRKTGNRFATALLGLRLPAAEFAEFTAAVGALNAEVGGEWGGGSGGGGGGGGGGVAAGGSAQWWRGGGGIRWVQASHSLHRKSPSTAAADAAQYSFTELEGRELEVFKMFI